MSHRHSSPVDMPVICKYLYHSRPLSSNQGRTGSSAHPARVTPNWHLKVRVPTFQRLLHIIRHVVSRISLLDSLFSERTEKIPMVSIKAVVSEAILGHEEYHIMVGIPFKHPTLWSIMH